jgi:SAM-dependent methyltransferase
MSVASPETAATPGLPRSYLRALDDGVADKLALLSPWLDPLALGPGEHLVDMGCGTGTLAQALARRYPGCRILARDADPAMRAAARQRLGDGRPAELDLAPGDARTTDAPGAAAWILSSVLHELHAVDGPSAVRQALVHAARQLRPGGRLIVRDFVRPPQAQRAVWLFHALDDIRPGQAFDDWAAAAPFAVCHRPDAAPPAPAGHRGFLTDVEAAFEYLFRKDCGDAWAAELVQRYGFWSRDDAVDAVAAAGLRLLGAEVSVNRWVIEHRVRGRARLQDVDTGALLEPPLTQLLLVAEAP